jgi:hypothetical protein
MKSVAALNISSVLSKISAGRPEKDTGRIGVALKFFEARRLMRWGISINFTRVARNFAA